jgi:hypothetical protein
LFQSKLLENTSALYKLIHSKEFKSGLLLSSLTLLQDVEHSHVKKLDKNAQLSCLRYLSRLYTRTTPFGAFVNLSFGRPNVNGFDNLPYTYQSVGESKSHVALNVFILYWLKKSVLRIPKISFTIDITINRTLFVSGNSFTFYTNIDNRNEVVNKIETNPFLFHLVDIVKDRTSTNLNYLIQYSTKQTGDSVERITAYLHNLLLIGFFELDIYGDGESDELTRTIAIFEKYSAEGLIDDIVISLKRLDSFRKCYASLDFSGKAIILKQAKQGLQQLIDNLNSRTIDPLESDVEDISKLLADNIFYEDYFKTISLKISQSQLTATIDKLNVLVRVCLHARYMHSELIKATAIFIERFKSDAIIGIVDFFNYYQECIINEKTKTTTPTGLENFVNQYVQGSKDTKRMRKEHWRKRIQDVVSTIVNNSPELVIPFELLENMLQNSSNAQRQYSVSLIPFWGRSEAGELSFFVNGVTVGYGKTFSRFLNNPFYQEIPEELIKWNTSNASDNEILVENNDMSYSNANYHPKFLCYRIALNSSAKQDEGRIGIDELKVRYNRISQEIELIHGLTNKRCRILDLELQAIETRSEMFRFLTMFDLLEVPIFDEFLNLVNEFYQKEGGHYFIPRIVLAGNIILQRQQFIFPKEDLPLREHGMSDETFFLKINKWKTQYCLPNNVFVRLKSASGFSSRDRDYYKPQYIQFESPIMLSVFEKILKKVDRILIVEEMLPHFSQWPTEKTNSFATELVVQWKSN